MRRVFVTCAIAVALHAATAFGAPIRQPLGAPRAALERRLWEDAVDDIFDDYSLLQASLVASGVHDEGSLAVTTRRFDAVVQRLQTDVAQLTSDRDRAATVLAHLHREFLTGSFDPHCGSVVATLREGRHNCVTAAILFAALAETIRLPVTALHAPGHVRVRIDGKAPFELEPTCAACFKQGDLQLIPWSAAPRALSSVALVGKLYYNQGVSALEAKQFSAATVAFSCSVMLDRGDRDANHNLLAALNNGAVESCSRRDFVAAAGMLDNAAVIDPSYPPLPTNELHLLGQWTMALCEAERFSEAIEVVQRAVARHPHSELARGGPAAVYRLWAESLVRRGEIHAAIARVETGLSTAPDCVELQRLKERLAKQPTR